MRLPDELTAALNDELTRERFSEAVYRAVAAQFETLNLSGFADWARRAADEEAGHGKGFFDYLADRNTQPKITTVPAAPALPADPAGLFAAALKQETVVSEALRALYALALNTGDYFTCEFLAPYLKEQVQAERELTEIVWKVQNYPSELLLLEAQLKEAK